MTVGYPSLYVQNNYKAGYAAAGGAYGTPAAIFRPQSTMQLLDAYFKSVDNNGNVNQNKNVKLAGTDQQGPRRTGIVEGYAAEFVTGSCTAV
jgi:hypothetical protein